MGSGRRISVVVLVADDNDMRSICTIVLHELERVEEEVEEQMARQRRRRQGDDGWKS
jgi:hypothetical protein